MVGAARLAYFVYSILFMATIALSNDRRTPLSGKLMLTVYCEYCTVLVLCPKPQFGAALQWCRLQGSRPAAWENERCICGFVGLAPCSLCI